MEVEVDVKRQRLKGAGFDSFATAIASTGCLLGGTAFIGQVEVEMEVEMEVGGTKRSKEQPMYRSFHS